MKYLNATFVKSAEMLSQCPDTSLPEFPLLGRSNVGKSSFINALSNNKKLAKRVADLEDSKRSFWKRIFE